jgi:hypothetical protein
MLVSYGLSLAHAGIIALLERWVWWPPDEVAVRTLLNYLFELALIYFVSAGGNWARLIYAVLLGVRTPNVILGISASWQYSKGLLLMVAISYTCKYMAMYLLFTEPGRRWFNR